MRIRMHHSYHMTVRLWSESLMWIGSSKRTEHWPCLLQFHAGQTPHQPPPPPPPNTDSVTLYISPSWCCEGVSNIDLEGVIVQLIQTQYGSCRRLVCLHPRDVTNHQYLVPRECDYTDCAGISWSKLFTLAALTRINKLTPKRKC